MKLKLLFLSLFICQILIAQQVETLVIGPSTFDDGLVLDKYGNIFAARYSGSTITKITPSGQTTIFASGLISPNGITFDPEGYLMVPEATGNKITRIDSAGNKTQFLTITNPTTLLYLPDGSLLITSYNLDKISILDTSGNISNYWTGSELSGGPVGLAYDTLRKTLFTAGFDDGRILKRDSLGIVTQIGDIPGQCGFICQTKDHIYATGYNTNRIYKMSKDTAGLSVLCGTGFSGQLNGSFAVATFNRPNGIVASNSGDTLYISDYSARSLRMITGLNSLPSSLENEMQGTVLLNIYPNPAKDIIYLRLKAKVDFLTIQIFDCQGKLIVEQFSEVLQNKDVKVNLPDQMLKGVYIIRVKHEAGIETSQFYKN